jgi:hypothetical protein
MSSDQVFLLYLNIIYYSPILFTCPVQHMHRDLIILKIFYG